MIKLLKYGFATVLVMVLMACAGTDTADPPAELVEITSEANIKTLWSVSTGKGAGDLRVTLVPYLSNGILYVADVEGNVVAVDASTGKKKWKVKTDYAVTAGVGGGSSLLFIGTRDGYFVALREENGEQVWKAKLTSELLAIPVVDLGMVVVRTLDGTTTAFSTATGDKVWSQWHTVPSLSLRGTGSPVAYAGAVITGTDNGELTALSIMEGRTLWESRVAVPNGRSELSRMIDIDMSPLIDQNIIYVAAFQGRIVAATLERGQILWARDKSVYLNMAVSAENLYAIDEMSHIWALGKESGATVWTQDKLHARPLTAPAVYKNYLVIGDFEGYLHVVDTADGRFIARTKTNGAGVLATPVVDNDVFYVLNRDGELSAMMIAQRDVASAQ